MCNENDTRPQFQVESLKHKLSKLYGLLVVVIKEKYFLYLF